MPTHRTPSDHSTAESRPLLRPDASDLAQLGRGVLMGAADIIPGVSGGTVALILKIYERLVAAISHFDPTLLALLAQRRLTEAAKHIDLRFLIPLGIGILVGVVALGSVMHTLLEDYRQLTMAAFFGMIGASCFLVGKLVDRWRGLEISLLIGGTVFAVWLVSQPALANPPDALWYVFLCGVIAICAMILPGISGSFLLLILGKYHEITGIIKEVLKLKLSVSSLLIVMIFGSGCVIGLISFSKILKWLLASHARKTMSVLCGFMLGSLYKIWPFQIDRTPEVVEFKEKQFEFLAIWEIPLDGMFVLTLGVLCLSAVAVLLLDRISGISVQQVALEDSSEG